MTRREATPVKTLQLVSGRSHPELAQKVAAHLGIDLCEANLVDFSSGEIGCRLGESVRGSDVFVLQTHVGSVNDCIMEQAIMIDAAKRASAKRVTAICPFFGYGRQDRKSAGREPITARLVSDIFHAAGAKRIMGIDLHSGQIQGYFDGPFDHLTAAPVLEGYIRKQFDSEAVIVSPDAGRVKTAERYSRTLGLDLAIVHKTRPKGKHNTVEALEVIGNVKGRTCILIDDMVDTAGTLVAAAEQLKKHGAKTVCAMATHGVLSGPAFTRLNASPIDRLVITDSMPVDTSLSDKIVIVSIAELLAAAISAVFADQSISEIFGGENQI